MKVRRSSVQAVQFSNGLNNMVGRGSTSQSPSFGNGCCAKSKFRWFGVLGQFSFLYLRIHHVVDSASFRSDIPKVTAALLAYCVVVSFAFLCPSI